jgi:thiosulfate dehydrogenase (quinone) large subunit
MVPPEMANANLVRPSKLYSHDIVPRVEHEARSVEYAWASARLGLGAIFFWAFIDKLFGLGYSTSAERAWINGGNPTQGYLSSSFGPFGDLFQAMAGNTIVNLLFMGGLAAVGLALLLGMGVRIAGYSGAAMMLFMYLSHPIFAASPHGTNPLVDDHVIYGIVLVGIALANAGRSLGLGQWWARQAFVRRYPILE